MVEHSERLSQMTKSFLVHKNIHLFTETRLLSKLSRDAALSFRGKQLCQSSWTRNQRVFTYTEHRKQAYPAHGGSSTINVNIKMYILAK